MMWKKDSTSKQNLLDDNEKIMYSTLLTLRIINNYLQFLSNSVLIINLNDAAITSTELTSKMIKIYKEYLNLIIDCKTRFIVIIENNFLN